MKSPLPEEFEAIFGFPSRLLVALPTLCEYYYKDFERYFNLHAPLLNQIVIGSEVDLLQFANLYFHLPLTEFYHIYKKRGYLYCALKKYLFASNNDKGQTCVLSILEGLEVGRSPFPTIVGETMLGLDALKEDKNAPMKGSPILLQV